jgi:hypothetical protein
MRVPKQAVVVVVEEEEEEVEVEVLVAKWKSGDSERQ